MYLTFSEFVDQRDNEKHFRHQLLHRLGLEDDTIKLRAVDPEKLHDALSSMDLDDETLNNVDAWLKTAPDSRLIDLIHQFGGSQSALEPTSNKATRSPGSRLNFLLVSQNRKQPPQSQMPLSNQPPMV